MADPLDGCGLHVFHHTRVLQDSVCGGPPGGLLWGVWQIASRGEVPLGFPFGIGGPDFVVLFFGSDDGHQCGGLRSYCGAVSRADRRVAYCANHAAGYSLAIPDVVLSDPEFDCGGGLGVRIGNRRSLCPPAESRSGPHGAWRVFLFRDGCKEPTVSDPRYASMRPA